MEYTQKDKDEVTKLCIKYPDELERLRCLRTDLQLDGDDEEVDQKLFDIRKDLIFDYLVLLHIQMKQNDGIFIERDDLKTMLERP